MTNKAISSIDKHEIEKFERMAASWWDPDGVFKPLHRFNPVRLDFIQRSIKAHFARTDSGGLEGLSVLDIGCGGGLVCEPLTRLGAAVTGIDASEKNIKVAALHASQMNLGIDYRATTAEELAASGVQFDVVLNLEVIEHVAAPDAFIMSCAKLIKPGGIMIIATLNRTAKSFALAIIGAEYILRWLPRGTHQWSKFLRPSEIATWLDANHLQLKHITGVTFNPLQGTWSLSSDTSVNYMMLAEKPV